MAQSLTHTMMMVPCNVIIAKQAVPGVEATMVAFGSSLLRLNQYTIREAMGITINDMFIHASRDNLSSICTLTIIAMLTSFIPLTFMRCLVPSLKDMDE